MDLMERDLWTDAIRNQIIAHNGSVQSIPEIPDDLKALYRTCWEMKMRSLIDMAADRGAFIDQSQSFNVFMVEPTDAIKFTVDQTALAAKAKKDGEAKENDAPTPTP